MITPPQRKTFLAIAFVLFAFGVIAPAIAGMALVAVLALWFVANAVFRAWLVWLGSRSLARKQPPPEQGGEFPLYSILVPLYREANVVPRLIRALTALDYPGIR